MSRSPPTTSARFAAPLAWGALAGVVVGSLLFGAELARAVARILEERWLDQGLDGLAARQLAGPLGGLAVAVLLGALLGFGVGRRVGGRAAGRGARWASGVALLVLLLALGAATVAQLVATRRPPPAPNVVWIVIDALRADHLGSYGYALPTSPFLDELARRSVLFELAVSQESYTLASAASYLTSTYPPEHGVLYDVPTIDVLDRGFVTLAEVLADAGWDTAAFVFNPHLQARYGFDQGFLHYDDAAPAQSRDKTVHAHEAFETVGPMREKVQTWLASVDGERPRFLYLHYRDVHGPYVPPPPHHTAFLPEGLGPGVHNLVDRSVCRPVADPDPAWAAFGDDPTFWMSQYDGEIRTTDEALRELFELLAENGLGLDDTIVIVTADHGEEFYDSHPGDPGFMNHGRTLYREQIHVPLIVSAPAARPRRVAQPVELVDIAPTIVDLVGVTAPPGVFAGRSLRPLLEGGTLPERAVYAGGNHGRGLVIGKGLVFYDYDAVSKRTDTDHAERPGPDYVFDRRTEVYALADIAQQTDLLREDPEGLAEEEALSVLADLLDAWRRQGAGVVAPTMDIDADSRERLQALGYLGGDG